MLRTSNQIRGVTHVIAGSIDVSWLVGALYQNTGIHISQIVRVCTTILQCSRILSKRFRIAFSLLIH
jgi:hypothetical protein